MAGIFCAHTWQILPVYCIQTSSFCGFKYDYFSKLNQPVASAPKHTSLTQGLHLNSQTQSGGSFFQDLPSTLMLSSVGGAQQSKILKSPMKSEISLSQLMRQQHPRQSRLPGTYSSPGTSQQLQQSLHSLIIKESARTTESTSSTCSLSLPKSPSSHLQL